MLNRSSNKGSLLIDFSLALAYGLLFIYIISELHFGTERMRNLSALYQDFINQVSNIDLFNSSYFQSSTTSRTISKMYGNYFTNNYIISSTTRNIINLIKISDFVRRDNRSLCFADLHKIYNFGSDLDYSSKNSTSTFSPKLKFERISLPIDPRNMPTDFEIRNNVAYVSFDSNISSDPDLIIFDMKDHKSLNVLSFIDSGPGISSFVLAERYIYASALSTAFQLHIFEINNLNELRLKSKYKLPLPYATSSSPYGTSIDFHNPYIYLGTNKWEGEELNQVQYKNGLFDRTSSFEIGSKVNEIYAFDDKVYLAGSNENQLVIFDNKNNILTKVSNFSGSGYERQEGKSLDIFEDNLVFGRSSGGFDIREDPELYLFSTSSEDSLPDRFLNEPGGFYGAIFDKDYIYLISHEVDKEFQIKDYALRSVADYSLPIMPKKIVCDLDKIYILSATSPDIYEISFQ